MRMGKGERSPGRGQLDMILDGMDDAELAASYDAVVGVRVVHRCEKCRHPITAEESRAYGIGHDCARDLGREVWARMRKEREAAERAAGVPFGVEGDRDVRAESEAEVPADSGEGPVGA